MRFQKRVQACKPQPLEMARKMDKMMSNRDEVKVNIMQVNYVGEIIATDIQCNLNRNESLGSLRQYIMSKFEIVEQPLRQYIMSKFEIVEQPEHVSFMFDEMLVEDEATPMGLGMVNDDTLVMIPTVLIGPKVKNIIKRTKRKAKEISVGLNVLVGEAEGGLPLPGSPALCPAPKCREQLANLRTALLPALHMTADEVVADGMAPDHRPDFSKVKKKLEEGQYLHAHQGFKEVEGIIKRYKQGTMIINNTLLEPCERTNEAMKRELMYLKIAGTMAEFYKAIEVPDCKAEVSDVVYYVGPPRNCTALNYLSCPPTVQLQGVTSETTVEELVMAWITYAKSDPSSSCVESVSYDNLTINLKSLTNGTKVESETCPGLRKHYFCLNIAQDQEDDRDIDQLLEFIEGDDGKEQDKKKKRKKKRKSEEVAGLEARAKALEAEADAFEAHAEALEAELDADVAEVLEAGDDKALEDKQPDISQNSLDSDLVGGCKKKVKSKDRTEKDELYKCIAQKEAMLEERRCYAESIIESKSKECLTEKALGFW